MKTKRIFWKTLAVFAVFSAITLTGCFENANRNKGKTAIIVSVEALAEVLS